MKNKKTLAIVCLVVIGLGVATFNSFWLNGSRTVARQRSATPTLSGGTKESPHPSQAPDHVVYRQFLRHVVALKKRAIGIETDGRSAKALRDHYKTRIGLKDKDADSLDQIAAEFDRETARVDAQAQRIIDNLRRRFPNRRLSSPEQLPPPPPELKKLQFKRDMIVMRARHRMATELGAQEFRQVNDYIKVNFARDVRPVVLPDRRGTPAQQPSPTRSDR